MMGGKDGHISIDSGDLLYDAAGEPKEHWFEPCGGTSRAARGRPFIEVPEGEGYPDGMTVDSEGFVWSARWGGWKVVRYDPLGNPEREIALPVAQVSCPAFGGAGLDELYVTTAWMGLSEADRRAQPLAGGLFRVRPGVKGQEEVVFRG